MSLPANRAFSVVAPSAASQRLAAALVIGYALIALIPMVWILLTSF
jgi:multiple sugar transport system permease protein